jgi:hypothetical protein
MRSLDDYLGKIINEHQKPKFLAEMAALLEPFVLMQQFLEGMYEDFDLDEAVGVQLDVLGMLIGISRNVGAPVTNNWFMLDHGSTHGLDNGYWKSPYKTEYYTTVLADEPFRKLLRSRILSNHWDGTIPGAQAILDFYFTDPTTHVWLHDECLVLVDDFFCLDDPVRGLDSSYRLRGPYTEQPGSSDPCIVFCMSGKLPDLPSIFLFYQGHIPVVGAGVRAEFRIASKDNSKLFALDVSNAQMGGLDEAYWGVGVDYLATYGLMP